MALQRKAPKEATIEVGSFSDIAFLMNIFFILTAEFSRPAGTKMEIPSGSADPGKKQDTMLAINVSPEKIFYGEKSEPMTLEELRRRLFRENLRAKPPTQRVVIVDASKDVPYERYFQVVTAVARANGVIALVEQTEKGEAGTRTGGRP
ncbi:MAG: biopolymer transporter ExbD [Planctomycetota bacterium]|nr:biopolymer transporter ExbD [Planctomycetota bacterium]